MTWSSQSEYLLKYEYCVVNYYYNVFLKLSIKIKLYMLETMILTEK